jgi:hypothetical protein
MEGGAIAARLVAGASGVVAITLVLSLVGAGCSPRTSSSSSETPLCFTDGEQQQPCLGCAVPRRERPASWAIDRARLAERECAK